MADCKTTLGGEGESPGKFLQVTAAGLDALIAASRRDMGTFGPIKEVLYQAVVGNVRNSYTALHFDTDGRLWLQVVNSLSAGLHPFLGPLPSDHLPQYRQYDVFGIDGKLGNALTEWLHAVGRSRKQYLRAARDP